MNELPFLVPALAAPPPPTLSFCYPMLFTEIAEDELTSKSTKLLAEEDAPLACWFCWKALLKVLLEEASPTPPMGG